MKISVITLFPEVFREFLGASIIGRAVERRAVAVELVMLRDFAEDNYRKCDDYPFGGGPGMVLKPEPLVKCFEHVGTNNKRIILTSPGGKRYDQKYAAELAAEKDLVILCGHYEGIDQRIIEHYITDEISVGDYILSGGESAAMVIIDSIVRLIDGVINPESLYCESFQRGLLEYPQYTRPREILGRAVPEILLTGNHEEIRKWRLRKSVEKTAARRPDLLEQAACDEEINSLLNERGGKTDGSDKGD